MEVKPGYKQTDIGTGQTRLPRFSGEWKVKRLGDLAQIQRGASPRPIDSPRWFDENSNVGWVRISDVTSAGMYLEQTTQRLSSDGIAHSRPVGAGNLIMSICATVGRPIITNIDVCIHDGFVVFDNLKVDRSFIYYALKWIEPGWSKHGQTGSQMNLNTGLINSTTVNLPPTDEQTAIASALSDMDALLDGLDRLIAKKRAIKQATMQQLLTGQTRLPGFSGEWEEKRLGDLADIRSGGTPSTGDAAAWDGTIPWCTPTDITALGGRKYLTTTNRAITEHGLSTSSAELIPARSIVMTSRATIGECAINAVPVTTNQGFKNLVPYDSVDVEFLYYLLSTQTQGLIGISAGSTFLEIGKTQLRQYEVKLPAEKEEQTAIASVLSDMDAEIAALETRRTKTRALKQAMMQELLTGRTRLLIPDAKPVGEVAAQTEGRKANVHFLRSVLAAEIVDQLHDQPTFGHVKLEKMMFLTEHLCQVDTGSTYHRKAAGPYDNRALRSIDSQLQKRQWFEARKQEGRYQYVPLAKRGGHKPYFDRHFSGIVETFEKILDTFKTAKTVQCEIVATLLAAWSDLLREKGTVSDAMIVHEVLHNWHEAKQRIPEDRWLKALGWMREKGFVPKGATLP